ncbi:hypothetical protein FNL39_102485 [Nocardia caishijiensis]|uniref:Uncharacterized protein n=1 Tax=Nocardia caishijiensis TaxID=184756 RepID=A0ABQ6YRA0_9NOCA|nr:hypothetical protein [Nocardia caishijiensis]KAF0848337.1 hypothetical protein FNL39_102485 [Nocardia caishijiensis]
MIGAASPLPYEYDHRFVYNSLQVGRELTADDPPWYPGTDFKDTQEALAAIPGVVAGWMAAGARRNNMFTGRDIATMVVRFTDNDHARFAYDELARRTKGEPGEIPGYSDARVRVALINGSFYRQQDMRAWLIRGDLLIHAALSDPVSIPFDTAANADIVKRFFDKQLAMLETYSPTPVAELDKVPLDVDGLLSRTLPADRGRPFGAVYPRQALFHLANRPDRMAPAIADADVDYSAVAGGSVYRTRDAAAAIRYLAAKAADVATNSKYEPMERPSTMPDARCYNAKPGQYIILDVPPICLTTVGRYVIGSVGANPQDTHQRLAAQYKLLAGYP